MNAFRLIFAISALLPICFISALAQEPKTKNAVPPGYERKQVKVMMKPAFDRLVVSPAKYKMETRRILVDESSNSYSSYQCRVMESPPTVKKVAIPAEYTVIDQLVRVDGKSEKKEGSIKQGEGQESLVFEYRDVPVEVEEPSLRWEVQPPQFQTVTERILLKEASDTTPAKYTTITRIKLAKPSTVNEVIVPARYKIVKTQTRVKPKPEKVGEPEEAVKPKQTTEERLGELESELATLREIIAELKKKQK